MKDELKIRIPARLSIWIAFFAFLLTGALIPGEYAALSAQTSSDTALLSGDGEGRGNSRRAFDGHVEGELLIKYKQTASPGMRATVAQRHSLDVVRRFGRLGIHHVRIPKGLDVAAYIERLKSEEGVEYVEPNYRRKPMGTFPNDPVWVRQWGSLKIGLPDAWDYMQSSRGVVVAVADTGVDYNHPDLSANIWRNSGEIGANNTDDDDNGFTDDVKGWNFYSNSNDPMDTYSHGTHVAGIIGAVGNNGLGVTGVNWRTKIMPVKFMDADGGDVAGEVQAIEYAVDNGAKIINASFGDMTYSQTEYDAIQSAGTKGVLFVAAAGNDSNNNDGGTKNYPSSYNLPNIIAVAASNADFVEGLASFSNYGATSVHLAAPGVTILSTIPESQASSSGALLSVPSAPEVVYYPAGMEYAGQIPSEGIAKIFYDCGYGYSEEFPPGVAGNIALIKRGTLTFAAKVANAQTAGAVAAIIYNNVSGSFSGTLGSAGQWIPTVSISMEEGESLLALGNPVVVLAGYPYGSKDGTSMATPFVSGVAAMLWAERPDATVSQIKQAILESVDSVASLNGRVITGGRLNAYKALQRIAIIAQNQTSLTSGWNFLSFPRLPSTDPPVETVLSDVSQDVVILWSYDSRARRWLRWKPSDSASTVISITADKGYWIYMNKPGTINRTGWLYGPQSVALHEGWNLIGYGGASGKKVTSALETISDNWSTIWSWADNLWFGKDKTILNLPEPIQPLEDMNMGKAYWIRVPPPAGELLWAE
jgi:subtilisin family serine protease